MKLNKTYPLTEMLKALAAASENLDDARKRAKELSHHCGEYFYYESVGMLSSSPHARVTLTRKVTDGHWAGYMETSAYQDGPKTHVDVYLRQVDVAFNEDYSKATLYPKKDYEQFRY